VSSTDEIEERLRQRIRQWAAERRADPAVGGTSIGVLSIDDVAGAIAAVLAEQREQIDHLRREIVLLKAAERGRRHAELRRETESDGDD
jgi:hypothetical protein